MFLACGTALLTIEWVRTEVVAGDKVTPMPVVATCAGCNCKHTIQWRHSYKLNWIRAHDIHKNNANWFPYKNIHDTVVTCISKYNFLLDHWKAFTCYAAFCIESCTSVLSTGLTGSGAWDLCVALLLRGRSVSLAASTRALRRLHIKAFYQTNLCTHSAWYWALSIEKTNVWFIGDIINALS